MRNPLAQHFHVAIEIAIVDPAGTKAIRGIKCKPMRSLQPTRMAVSSRCRASSLRSFALVYEVGMCHFPLPSERDLERSSKSSDPGDADQTIARPKPPFPTSLNRRR
jgi:hypothetical protein